MRGVETLTNQTYKELILWARGSFRAGRFAVYRARPVNSGSSEVGANPGSEVGRERQLGVFLERWNNGRFLSATERDRD